MDTTTRRSIMWGAGIGVAVTAVALGVGVAVADQAPTPANPLVSSDAVIGLDDVKGISIPRGQAVKEIAAEYDVDVQTAQRWYDETTVKAEKARADRVKAEKAEK